MQRLLNSVVKFHMSRRGYLKNAVVLCHNGIWFGLGFASIKDTSAKNKNYIVGGPMKNKPNENPSLRTEWTQQHSSGPQNSGDKKNVGRNVVSNQLRSDSYRGTSRDEVDLDGVEPKPDYDYQDHESYQVPTRNSQLGYAPIEQQQADQEKETKVERTHQEK